MRTRIVTVQIREGSGMPLTTKCLAIDNALLFFARGWRERSLSVLALARLRTDRPIITDAHEFWQHTLVAVERPVPANAK